VSLGVKIQDGGGSGRQAEVTDLKALKVSVVDIPSSGVPNVVLTQYKQWRAYLVDSGASSSLVVNASSGAPQYFRVSAQDGKTIWLTGIRLVMHDAQMNMGSAEIRRFGSVAAAPGLTNGLLLYSMQGGVRSDFFLSAIKNLADFLIYTSDFVNVGDAIGQGTDLTVFAIYFSKPICLPQGSVDTFTMEIRDNLTSMTLFQGICEGWQEIIV